MPAQPTNWKAETRKLQEATGNKTLDEILKELAKGGAPSGPGSGRVVLEAGTRASVGNGPQYGQGDAEINRRMRERDNRAALEKRKKKPSATKTIEQRLKGLFGGG